MHYVYMTLYLSQVQGCLGKETMEEAYGLTYEVRHCVPLNTQRMKDTFES